MHHGLRGDGRPCLSKISFSVLEAEASTTQLQSCVSPVSDFPLFPNIQRKILLKICNFPPVSTKLIHFPYFGKMLLPLLFTFPRFCRIYVFFASPYFHHDAEHPLRTSPREGEWSRQWEQRESKLVRTSPLIIKL